MAVGGDPNDVFLIDDISSELALSKKIEIWEYLYEVSCMGPQLIVNTHDLVPFLLEKKGLIKYNLIDLDNYMGNSLEKLI